MINVEGKPALLGKTRSIKIVDLRVRKRHRQNQPACKYCGLPIQAKYALSKITRAGTRYYHVECAIKVGFDIAVQMATVAAKQTDESPHSLLTRASPFTARRSTAVVLF